MELRVSIDYDFNTAFLLYCGELYEVPLRDANGLVLSLKKRLGEERRIPGDNIMSHVWDVNAGQCRAVWSIVDAIKDKKLISERVWDF